MKAIKEICVAGKTIEVILKLSSGNHREKRNGKLNITPEAVRKNNDRLAVLRLRRILNANFGYGDMHIVLTYREAPDPQQAKKDRNNFIKSMQRKMRKAGRELKYIAVTEYMHARIHHHIVINCSDIKLLTSVWKHGLIKAAALDDSGNYAKLAEYLLKETQKSFREEGCPNKRRYAASTNLVKPQVVRQAVDVEQLFEEPQAIKGYYIPEDYNRRYEHPVTGLEHVEYIMVALDRPRRYKKWPKGKVVSDREYFKPNYAEEQLGLMCWDEIGGMACRQG